MSSTRIGQLNQFLEKSPNDLFLNHALALEYVKAEEDDLARLYFEKNLQIDPNYVGTYYHLGKLLERQGNVAQAIEIYTTGMNIAQTLKDNHSYNELQGAYEDLAY